ncbi:MAG: cytochrome P450 [Planctomycetota bacterium]
MDGQTPLPLANLRLADLQADVLGGLLKLHEQFGPVAGVQDGALRVLFSFDPLYNKQMLSDVQAFNARFFAIRGPKRSSQRRVTCGLLAMNGDQWKRNRRMVKEPFSLRQIASYKPTIARLAEETASSWTDGQAIDLNEEMTRYLLRVTSTILFGMDESPEERNLAYEVGEQIAEWALLNHQLGVGALVPDTAFNEGYERLLAFSEQLESQVMRLITRRREGAGDGNDVLSILVRSHDDQGGLTDEELVGQSCVLFGAAHMTTAHSLTWTLTLLAQHPEVRRALDEHYAKAGAADEEPGRADPNSLPERVIREGMRLLPASSYSQRINTEPVDFGPFKQVPRGTPMVFSPLITHRLERLYPNPKRFDPDRWLTIKPSAYEYLPMGAGPRLCIGGPLAMEVIRMSIPRLLAGRTFRVEPGSDVSAEIRSTMLHPTHGVPMTLHDIGVGHEASSIRGNVPGELVEMPS